LRVIYYLPILLCIPVLSFASNADSTPEQHPETETTTPVSSATNDVGTLVQTNTSETAESETVSSTTNDVGIVVQTNASETAESEPIPDSALADPSPERDISPPHGKKPASVSKLTYFVHQEDSGGRGSAFLLEDADGVWLISNSHVFGGSTNITIINIEGNRIEVPPQIEIAKDRDVIRFRADQPQGLCLSTSCEVDETIYAYGDSGGAGVLTKLEGKAVALGPDRIEISAEIIPGNSGGPVINTNHEVVGVSSYLLRHNDLPDWIADGTRFTDTRRMALRLNDIEWTPVDFTEYYRQTFALAELEKIVYTAIAMVGILSDDISNTIMGSPDRRDLQLWIKKHNRYAREGSSSSRKRIRRNVESLGKIIKEVEDNPTPDCEITIPFLKDKLKDIEEACEATRRQAEALSS